MSRQPYQSFNAEVGSQQSTINVHPFEYKANATKKLGVCLMILGGVTFLQGILILVIAPEYWLSISGTGIWCGLFIIITGVLCFSAGSNPKQYGVRCAAFTFCILTIVLATGAALIFYIGFGTSVNEDERCYYDQWSQKRYCDEELMNGNIGGWIVAILSAVVVSIAWICLIFSSIYTSRGCCRRNQQKASYNQYGTYSEQQQQPPSNPQYHQQQNYLLSQASAPISDNGSEQQSPAPPPYSEKDPSKI